jgi:hypothetical protein
MRMYCADTKTVRKENLMTFDTWWASLTNREKDLIGVNNARFVWESAQQALRNEISMAFEKMPFGNTSQSFAAFVREFK